MALTLADLRARKEARKALLEKNLDSISLQLQNMGAQRIILIGSLAQGRVNSRSDLDLLCVMPPSMSGWEWMLRIYDEVDRNVDCDILAFTEEELRHRLTNSRFLKTALSTGRVVYDREPT